MKLDKLVPGAPSIEITGITADSRKVKPGYLFAALQGVAKDGREYIDGAIKSGAVAILTDDRAGEWGVPSIKVSEPRLTLATASAAFHPEQPGIVAAVTGTNGKSSTVDFLRQIWAHMGRKAASMGTLGAIGPSGSIDLGHTTPDPVMIHETLSKLANEGVTHAAMEASSHGLSQYRLHGVKLAAGAFTNLTQDHLDYHVDFDDYRAAKLRLFTELLSKGAPAVINADSPELDVFEAAAKEAGLKPFTVGWRGRDLRIAEALPRGTGQDLVIQWGDGPSAGNERKVHLPLIGEFQALNALCAAGIAMALGDDVNKVLDGLAVLKGVHGRLELVGQTAAKAPVFVDYAHTPDGLNVLLRAARPHVRGKLIVVFGCGGDRDATKRPIMGDVARRLADEVIVTDDNPRSEDAAKIRAAVRKGVPEASEIGDRASAIIEGVKRLKAGDALLIAGKGHETGQIVKGVTIPFSDFDVARAALTEVEARMADLAMTPLWTSEEAEKATGGKALGTWATNGVSIDTRSLQPGNLFVALKDVRDGHEFVGNAFSAGAEAALVSRDVLGGHPGLMVHDVLDGLEKLGLAARERNSGVISAVTGSVGKTSVKEMLARIFRAAGRAHWSDKSFNNHWGVPLTLARMPRETERSIFEIGMNTPGEIGPRSIMVRPHISMITRVAPAHLQGMGSVDAVADEKGQIFAGLEPGGTAILPERDYFFAKLKRHAETLQPTADILTYGGARGPASATPVSYETDGMTSRIAIDVMGDLVLVKLDAVGEHWAANAALALLAAVVAGVAPHHAAEALSGYAPPAGRGVAETLKLSQGGDVTLVDDAYNANPESMRAAIEGFARRPGRKIIALGEMRELGDGSAALHAGLATSIISAKVSAAVLSGGEMKYLADALKSRDQSMRVVHVTGPAEAAEQVKSWLEPGDAVLIKGSNASGMAKVGTALRQMSESAASSQKASGA